MKQRNTVFRVGLLGVAVLLGSVAFRPLSADDVLNKYFAAVWGGDIRNWEKVKSVFMEYTSSSYDKEGKIVSPPIVFRTYSLYPKNQRTDVVEDGGAKVQMIYKDDTIYSFLPHTALSSVPAKSPPFEFDAVVLNRIVSRSLETKFEGLRKVHGKSIYEITFSLPDVIWRYYFNAENFLIETAEQVSVTGEILREMRFSHYATTDGFVIPMKVDVIKNGVHRVETRRKVDFKATVDSSAFTLPREWRH